MQQINKHGFIKTNDDIVTDAQVLATNQKEIDNKRLKLNYYDYVKWKLSMANKVLRDRAEQYSSTKEYDPELTTRIQFTQKVIDKCLSILNEEGK